jgi:hypothetical protein
MSHPSAEEAVLRKMSERELYREYYFPANYPHPERTAALRSEIQRRVELEKASS